MPAAPPNTGFRAAIELTRIAAPFIAITFSRMLMSFIDFIMVGGISTAAQAAISPATIFVFAVSCLGMGAAQCVQTFVSQAEGRGEPQRAGAYVWQSLWLSLIFGVVTAPLVWTTRTWYGAIADFAGCTPDVRELQIQYLEYALWSITPAIMSAGLMGFFNGLQRTRVAVIATVLSIVVNAAGNYVLIYGKFGFPEMGVGGAGLATMLGWSVRAVIMFFGLLEHGISERCHTRTAWRFDAARFGELIRIGAPISITWLADISSLWAFTALLMPQFGPAEMAASNITIQVMHLAFMPAIGFGIAVQSQVGNAIGRRAIPEARARAQLGMQVAGAYMGLIGLLMILGRTSIIRLFNANDPSVLAPGAHALTWAAIFQVADAASIIYVNALRGAADTRIPAAATLLSTWLVFIGGGWVASQYFRSWGVNGPWLAFTLHISGIGLFLWLRFRSTAWEKINLFEAPAPAAAG